MEKKIAAYANGFSLVLNKAAGEAIITFSQNQPGFNPESRNIESDGCIEVTTVIIPFGLAEQLNEILKDCLEKEKTGNIKE